MHIVSLDNVRHCPLCKYILATAMSDRGETLEGSPHFVSLQRKLTTSPTHLQSDAEVEHNVTTWPGEKQFMTR